MTDRNEFDEDPRLRALLGEADPARSLAPADPQGLSRLLEDTMNDTDTTTGSSTGSSGRRGPLAWLAGAAAVAVIAGGGVAIVSSMSDDEAVDTAGDATTSSATTSPTTSATADPVVVTLEAPGIAGKCAVPSPEILGQFDTAFSGTVTAIDGDVVTLTPDETFLGQDADEIDIVGAMPDPRMLGGQVSFEVGQTYYVSATDGQVSACGYSGSTSDSDLAQLYQLAFR